MKSPIIMVKPPSPDMEITWRGGGLRADGMQHGVGHRAVIERSHQPSLAVHLEVAGRPGDWRADVAGEDRIVIRPARSPERGTY